MLKLYLRHLRSVTSSHTKIHYHFIFNHSLFTNLFVQTVKFVMWVKPQGTSSPESMNTYRKTLSPTSLNICKNHVHVIIVCNKDCFSVIDRATTAYQFKMKEAMHIKSIRPKFNKQVKHYTLSLIVQIFKLFMLFYSLLYLPYCNLY